MKKLLTILTLTAFAAIPATSFAADKKEAAAAKPAEAKAEKAKEEKPAEAKEGKNMPMNARVDAIDAAGKTFTQTLKKDGSVVKFVLTDKTDIKNGGAAAKFEDIKVGDTVSGVRMKKSDTEYEVVKITKFGVAAPKEKKADGEKKPEGEKKAEGDKPAEKKAEKKE